MNFSYEKTIIITATPATSQALKTAYAEIIHSTASNHSPAIWLSDHAVHFTSDLNKASQSDIFSQIRGRLKADIATFSSAPSRRKLFLADMDSTMIQQECIDELADFVGLKTEVSAITERAMLGELPFEEALRARVALLKGLPIAVVDQIIDERITLTPGGATLVATMKAHGAYTCLVSGGFTHFTSKIAQRLGFDEHRANELVVIDGLLTGEVKAPILGREAKRATLVELRERLNLTQTDTMAVGDGANDLSMIAEAGLGVAFHAKPAVAEAADARIDFGDLSSLLFLQGYSEADFIAA